MHMMARKRPSGQNRRIQQAFVTGRMNGIMDLFDYMREKRQETDFHKGKKPVKNAGKYRNPSKVRRQERQEASKNG